MGQKLIDETGKKFGALTVISLTKDKNGRTAWLCQCDCGDTKIANSSQRPILVATESSKTYIKQICHKYGYNINVYSIKDVKEGKICSSNYNKFLVDEVDQVLAGFMNEYNISPDIGTLTIGGK